MKSDVQNVLALLRDPQGGDVYRAKCGLAPIRQQQLDDIAKRFSASNPDDSLTIGPSVYANVALGEYQGDEYSAQIWTSCLTDVFMIHYHGDLHNRAPAEIRLAPFLEIRSEQPLIRAMQKFDEGVTSQLRTLGWRRMLAAEYYEYCPSERISDLLYAGRALERDVNGWLDNEPLPDEMDSTVAPYYAAVLAHYGHDATARLVESTRDAFWVADIEALLHASGAAVERLSPTRYPSISWTADFGELHTDEFHGRFVTDVHVSKLAPTWYYTDRFAIKSPHPDALQEEFTGWTIKEIGYSRPQTNMVWALRSALETRGFTEIPDWCLWAYVPLPLALRGKRESALLGELLFRDVLDLFPHASRLEEEHMNRDLRLRAVRSEEPTTKA